MGTGVGWTIEFMVHPTPVPMGPSCNKMKPALMLLKAGFILLQAIRIKTNAVSS